MDIKQITNDLQDEIYKGENLSLPYVIEHDNKEKLAYFVFSCSDSDNVLEITKITRIIVVEYDTLELTYLETLPCLKYPIIVSFNTLTSIDKLNQLYEKYYNSIEKYMCDKSTKNEYSEIANEVMSADLKQIYKSLSAKLI